MVVTFVSTIDSVSEDGRIRFVDRPGGYQIPQGPDDVRQVLRRAFLTGQPVEVSYVDRTFEIEDARLV